MSRTTYATATDSTADAASLKNFSGASETLIKQQIFWELSSNRRLLLIVARATYATATDSTADAASLKNFSGASETLTKQQIF
ncbi:MAG: hypothetical protein SR1Q7_11150 [Quinella sp. 1Q7]|nr:hypothetical protein [Quinella sp. 1Q7]